MKKLLFVLIMTVACVGIGLTYIGIMPGLSKYVLKPRDLGVHADPAIVTAFDTAHNMKNEIPGGIVPRERQALFSGSTTLDVDLSNEELTSIVHVWKARSPKLPVRDIQIRINQDGTGEVSGILEIATAVGIAHDLGYNDADIAKGKEYVKYVSGDLPFYLHGTASVVNNNVTISPTTAEIGRVTIPTSISSPAARVVEDMIERRIAQVGNINVTSMTLQSGKIHFAGKVPDTVR